MRKVFHSSTIRCYMVDIKWDFSDQKSRMSGTMTLSLCYRNKQDAIAKGRRACTLMHEPEFSNFRFKVRRHRLNINSVR